MDEMNTTFEQVESTPSYEEVAAAPMPEAKSGMSLKAKAGIGAGFALAGIAAKKAYDYFAPKAKEKLETRRQAKAIAQLEKAGFDVKLTPKAEEKKAE